MSSLESLDPKCQILSEEEDGSILYCVQPRLEDEYDSRYRFRLDFRFARFGLVVVGLEIPTKSWKFQSHCCNWTYGFNKFLALVFHQDKKQVVGLANWDTGWVPSYSFYLDGDIPDPVEVIVRVQQRKESKLIDLRARFIPGLQNTNSGGSHLSFIITDFLLFELEADREEEFRDLSFAAALYKASTWRHVALTEVSLYGSNAIELTRTKNTIIYGLAWTNSSLETPTDFFEAYAAAVDWCSQRYHNSDFRESRPFSVWYTTNPLEHLSVDGCYDVEDCDLSAHVLGASTGSPSVKLDLQAFFEA
jgi:hypothetical protein